MSIKTIFSKAVRSITAVRRKSLVSTSTPTKPKVIQTPGQEIDAQGTPIEKIVVIEEPKRVLTKGQKKIVQRTEDILRVLPKLQYSETEGIKEGPTFAYGEYTLAYKNNTFIRGVTNRTVRSKTPIVNKPFP